MTIFGLLELGRRALQTHQAAIQTRGHNVANAQTPGYSRQRVELAASLPENLLAAGQLGTGVSLEQIIRIRDQFLDLQFRRAASRLGEAEVEEATFRRIQALLDEPSDRGLGQTLTRFFSSFQDLAVHPTDLSTRFQVRERGLELVSAFRRLDGELDALAGELEGEMDLRVREVNDLAGRIAELNQKIRSLEAGGASANDLRDLRDRLIDDLSRLVALSVKEQPDGTVQITVGGSLLVDGTEVNPMAWENQEGQIQLLLGGNPIQIEGGRLKGLLESQNDLVPWAQATLDKLAQGIILEVNQVHSNGFGLQNQQGPFFSGTGAADIGVDSQIQQDVNRIAAAAMPSSPGDNTNARALAGLRQALTMDGNTLTFEGFYSAFVGEVGLQTQGAGRLVEAHQAMVDTLSTRREEVSGVSVDEELTHLIEHQRVYEAMSHFVRIVDELLETLIRELG